MTDKICYWDDETKQQLERDATPEEQAEIDERRAQAVAEAPRIAILTDIDQLEQSNPITHRALREMALGTFGMFNTLIRYCNLLESRVATLEGKQPAPLPEIVPSYGVQTTASVDQRISELRAQL